MFTENFLSLDSDAIANTIATDGIFSIKQGITRQTIEAIKADVANTSSGINRNWVTGVYANRQYYLSHMLATSRAFSGLVTHPKVFEILERAIGQDYRLKAHRYYETYGRHKMQWHTDNKTDRGAAQIPGLIFIAYMSDVADGEFQYIRGSHEWSGQKAYNDYPDDFVEKNFGKDILDFKGPAGTVVIYNTYGIHRAKPVSQPGFVRKSLFWQVDAAVDSAEPLLINPEFFYTIDDNLRQYLGFGRTAGYKIFPETDLDTLPLDQLKPSQLARWITKRSMRNIYDRLPPGLKDRVKVVLRH